MRQQYHFRKIDGKTHIWNVNKLVQQSEGLEVKSFPLLHFTELNEPYWFNQGDIVTANDFIHHMQLVNEASLDFPILLCKEGRIIDGMHRVVKAVLLGLTHINAIQLVKKIEPDFIDVDPDTLPYDD